MKLIASHTICSLLVARQRGTTTEHGFVCLIVAMCVCTLELVCERPRESGVSNWSPNED